MKKKVIKPYTVIRDTQEKKNFWRFIKTDYCTGTVDDSLWTGDYTIKGMEDIFSMERKASTGEFAGNVLTKQFENELRRGDKLKHFFIVLEFSLANVLEFPYNSGIPPKIWPKLRVSGNLILKKIVEFQVKHKAHIIFAGDSASAKEIARAIFKKMAEMYPDKVSDE